MIPQAYNNVNVNVLLLIALLINGVILYGSLRINKLMKIPFLRIGKPWNKNAAILCSVPDTHGYVYSQKTGYVYSQKTAYVYSQKTGYVYSQTTGYVYSQKTGYVYSQKTGYVYSQKTGYVYSQKTGYLYSQMTGYVYSPKTGKPYNSKSHWEQVNQRAYTTTQTWSKTCKPKGLHNNTDLIKNM